MALEELVSIKLTFDNDEKQVVFWEPRKGDRLECEHGSYCCSQTWDGVEPLGEGNGRHALTTLSEPPERIVKERVLPSVEDLAYAMFRTNTEVIDFARSVCDGVIPTGPNQWSFKWGAEQRAIKIMWHRDEKGWKTTALDRARRVLDALPGKHDEPADPEPVTKFRGTYLPAESESDGGPR